MRGHFLSIRGVWLALAAVGAVLLAAGCGGGSSEAGANGGEITVETGSLSKAEFIKQADVLCEKSKGRLLSGFTNLVKESSGSQSGQPQSKAIVDSLLLPTYEELIDEISALGAPSGDEVEVAAFLKALRKELDHASDQPSKALDRLTPFVRTIKLARAYGLTGCADSLGG